MFRSSRLSSLFVPVPAIAIFLFYTLMLAAEIKGSLDSTLVPD
jgi:hypothetical protein